MNARFLAIGFLLFVLAVLLGTQAVAAGQIESKVFDKLHTESKARVIVVFDGAKAVRTISPAVRSENMQASSEVLRQLDSFELKYAYNSFPGFSGYVSEKDLEKLKQMPGVKVYSDEQAFHVGLSQSAPHINASRTRQLQLSGINITGRGEAVCVIDTGANYTHTTLGGCFGNNDQASSCKVIGGYDFVNSDSDPMDDAAGAKDSHGTHVAGIIVGNDTINTGVAPDARILALKAFDSTGSASTGDIAAAIDWCVSNKTAYNISVISMSFGNGGQYNTGNCPYDGAAFTAITSVINSAYSNGIALVAASGNDYYSSGISYPACHENVTSVGATDNSDNIADFSNSGNTLDLLAPGTSIASSVRSGGFGSKSGTSMAAPHVSGAAVLLKQYFRLKAGISLTPAQVDSKLKNSGKNITDSRNNIVTPRANIFAALAPLLTVISPQNKTYATNTINFNLSADFLAYSANVTVDGTNYILSNDSAANWFNLSVNLSDGNHAATFRASSDSDAVASVYFTTDTTAPQITLNSPANNSIINSGQAINFTITDNLGLSTVNHFTSRNATNVALASPYLINTSTWLRGNITLSVSANDSTGNSNSGAYVFTVNNTVPTASNISITPSSPYANDTLACSYSYSDTNGDAENGTQIVWYLNGAANSTFENSTTVNSTFLRKAQVWQCAVKPGDGTAFGAIANSTNITVQNFPVKLVSSTLSSGKVAGVVLINATLSDIDVGEVDNVTAYYQNSTQTTLIGSDAASPYSVGWNTSTVADMNYTVIINATDGTTNSNLTVANIFVDNNKDPPAITITSPNGGETWSGTQAITWSASDPDHDSLNFAVYYSGSNAANWTKLSDTTATSLQWDTTTASNGAGYRINVTATDGTYNISDISNADFTISNSNNNNNNNVGGGGGGGESSGGGGGGNLDPNKKSFLFLEVAADSAQSASISSKAIPVSEIEFTTNEKVVNAKVSVTVSDGSSVAGGMTYKQIDIETANLDGKIKSAKIKFKIDSAWLKSNNIDKNKVKLYRNSGGWQALDTVMTASDDLASYYSAATPGFSTFAIVGEKLAEQAKPAQSTETGKTGQTAAPQETAKVSGFTAANIAASKYSKYAVLALLIVAAIVVVAIRFPRFRKKKSAAQTPAQWQANEYSKKWAEYYKRRQLAIQRAQQTAKANKTPRIERLQKFIKWLFTDTKATEEQARIEKSKSKERPDFGF